MPFEQPIPRPFIPADIKTYAPVAPGVYGISNAREWLYIGATDNIQTALLAHLQESDTPLSNKNPTKFVFEICELGLRSARQDRLVLECEPTCNRRSVSYGYPVRFASCHDGNVSKV
jgi:hypothetical protein